MEEYKKHEFCKENCEFYEADKNCCGIVHNERYEYKCARTFREFFTWLKSNGYKIVKE